MLPYPFKTLNYIVQYNFQNKVYSAYPVKDFNFDKDIGALKVQTAFNKSLSVFPMPDDVSHYKLHRFVRLNLFCLEFS